jgi:hypothetical protein
MATQPFNPDAFMASAPKAAFNPDTFMGTPPAQQAAPEEGWWQKNVSDPINGFLLKHGVPTYGGEDAISKHITSAADKINEFMDKPEFQAATGALGGGLGTTGTSAASQLVPSVERAGQHFNEISNLIGKQSVVMTNALKDATDDVKDMAGLGGQMPKVVNDFMTRISNTDLGPLNYDEARRLMTQAGRKMGQLLSANEQRITDPEIIHAVGKWYGALRDAVETTADHAEQLAKFQSAMSEYRAASKLRAIGGAVTKTAGGIVGASALGAAGRAGWNAYNNVSDAMGGH